MMDIGVARPSAQGQAMIKTATAFTSACAKRGSGPTVAGIFREHGTAGHAAQAIDRDDVIVCEGGTGP